MIKTKNKNNWKQKMVILFCCLFAFMVQTNVCGANIDLQQKKKNKNKTYNPSEVVKVTSRGEGKDRDEAINMALRDALERTNQSFVSSVSLFSDDEISYDEIARVSKGNIAKFDVIYGGVDEQGRYSVLVDAYVSATNLADYVENKGGSVRIKGFDFVQNHMQKLKLAMFYKENELTAIYNLFIELCQFSGKLYDYSIDSTEPKVDANNKFVNMKLIPHVKPNNNYNRFQDCLNNTLKSLSIPNQEIDAYKSLNLSGPFVYDLDDGTQINLRNIETVKLLNEYVKVIKDYGQNDYVVENNLGKRIKVTQKTSSINFKCSMEEFSNLESFSITPSLKPLSFTVCNDPNADFVDRVKVGFSGYLLAKNKYPDMVDYKSVSNWFSSDMIFESNRPSDGEKFKTNYTKYENEELFVLLNNTLRLVFFSPYLYDYSVQGNSAKVWETLTYKGNPFARSEATITTASGIGFPKSWLPTEKIKELKIEFEDGVELIVNVSSKLYFDFFSYKDKKFVRPVLEFSIPLDHLEIDKYTKFSYAERKKMFSRQLCLYKISKFHIDTNELWFKYSDKMLSHSNYTGEVGKQMKRNERGDKKGFYPQNIPDADFFLNLFYKKGAKDNSLESYGLAKVIGL